MLLKPVKITIIFFFFLLLPVNDEEKFQSLILKSSAGCAGKPGSLTDDTTLITNTWENLYNKSDYTMLDKERLRLAINAPSQNSNPNFERWCCGPNSGFRAVLYCESNKRYEYNSFIENCPKTLSAQSLRDAADNFNRGMAPVAALNYTVGAIFAPFTFGASFIPALLSGAAMASAHEASRRATNVDVGQDQQY